MPDRQFNHAYRRFMKYTVRPQMQWAFLRDTPSQDRAIRRAMRRKLAQFILRHPLRALRVPW
jgi:hypothetical protein